MASQSFFESGGGNDATVWKSLAEEIHIITNATIITYDRVGYGKSEYDPTLANDKKSLITHGIDALVKGLKKLDLDKELILVGHSYGGYYATYLASKHPDKIKAIVLIDAVLSSFHTEEFIKNQEIERTDEWLENIKNLSKPLYYECLSNVETIQIMKNYPFPNHIPVFDLYAENSPYEDKEDDERWKLGHIDLIENYPNVKGLEASNCGHYLHYDNPKLAVDAIVDLFIHLHPSFDKTEIVKRYLKYSIGYTNNYRKQEYNFWHSESDINAWGYDFINDKKYEEALRLMELNTLLYPKSANVWDSYGEILLLYGKKDEAKKAYKKALELNPDNDKAKAALNGLKSN